MKVSLTEDLESKLAEIEDKSLLNKKGPFDDQVAEQISEVRSRTKDLTDKSAMHSEFMEQMQQKVMEQNQVFELLDEQINNQEQAIQQMQTQINELSSPGSQNQSESKLQDL